MPRVDLDNPKLTFQQRRMIQLYKYVYVGSYQKEGWLAPIKHYAFNCRRHGIVIDYPHGYWGVGKGTIPVVVEGGTVSQLYCPKCEAERRGK